MVAVATARHRVEHRKERVLTLGQVDFCCCFFFSSPLLFFCTVLMIDIRFMFLRKLVCFLYYTECRCAIRATMK